MNSDRAERLCEELKKQLDGPPSKSPLELVRSANDYLRSEGRGSSVLQDEAIGASIIRDFVDRARMRNDFLFEVLAEIYLDGKGSESAPVSGQVTSSRVLIQESQSSQEANPSTSNVLIALISRVFSEFMFDIIDIVRFLKAPIQLAGLGIAVAAIVITKTYVPGNVPILIAGGSLGVAVIVFAQIFVYIDQFERSQRALFVFGMFVVFLIFEGTVVYKVATAIAQSVKLYRTVDLTNLSCDGHKKRDLASITDTYTFSDGDLDTFHPSATTLRGQQVSLLDLTTNGETQVSSPVVVHNPDDETRFTWTIGIRNRIAKFRFDWVNAFSSDIDGVEFLTTYRISDLNGQIILPPNVKWNLREIKFKPERAQEACNINQVSANGFGFQCHDLQLAGPIDLTWAWDVWKDCQPSQIPPIKQ